MSKKEFENISYTSSNLGIPHRPIGVPNWKTPRVVKSVINRQTLEPPPLAMPGSNLPRALNYLADYSGCGLWRLGAAEVTLVVRPDLAAKQLAAIEAD